MKQTFLSTVRLMLRSTRPTSVNISLTSCSLSAPFRLEHGAPRLKPLASREALYCARVLVTLGPSWGSPGALALRRPQIEAIFLARVTRTSVSVAIRLRCIREYGPKDVHISVVETYPSWHPDRESPLEAGSSPETAASKSTGISNAENIKASADRARSNSYTVDTAAIEHSLGTAGCDQDIKCGMPELPKQKREEGRGWVSPINPAAKPNTTTGQGDTKRKEPD